MTFGRKWRRVWGVGLWFLVAAGMVLVVVGLVGIRVEKKMFGEEVGSGDTEVEEFLFTMDAQARVGQMISLPSSLASESGVLNFMPGFVGLFGVEEKTLEQVRAEVGWIKQEATASGGVMPFVMVDQEGGRVQRLKEGFGEIMGWEEMCRTKSLEEVRWAAQDLGGELKRVGVDGVWGPVVDRVNPESKIMRGRACSDEPEKILEYASEYMKGLSYVGVLSVAKHFPGLGGSSADPHQVYGSVAEVDWEVFGQLLSARLEDGLMGVMVTHVGVGDDLLPCSVSSKCVAELDRRRCAQGECKLLFTDALEMRAVADKLSLVESAYGAIMAGEDVLVYGEGFGYEKLMAVRDQLVVEYRNNPDFRARVDESVGRILKVKNKIILGS